MNYTTIRPEVDADGILTVTLNRPDLMNAFTVEMADELEYVFRWASNADEVKAIIVTGAGKAYCAGMDLRKPGNPFGLNESLEPTLDDVRKRIADPKMPDGLRDTGGRVSISIYECTKPVIGAINGVAVGVGATMTLAMDIRLASEHAKFGFVFGRIGITAEACSTWFLPRIVGLAQALEWIYSADIFGAEEALQAGLVKAIYPADKLLSEARALALKLVSGKSPVATALARQMMYRNSAYATPIQAHEVESLSMFYTSKNDGKRGVAGFLEKKAPDYKLTVSKDMPPFYPWW